MTIEELRRLAAAATLGPWHTGGPARHDGVWADESTGYDREEGLQTHLVAWCHSDWKADEDAALIAAMRNALPALLDVAEFAGYVVAQADGKEWFETGGPDVSALRAALKRLSE